MDSYLMTPCVIRDYWLMFRCLFCYISPTFASQFVQSVIANTVGYGFLYN